MKRYWRLVSFVLAIGICAGVLCVPRVAHAVADEGTCQSVMVPVALGDGLPTLEHIYGELCMPASGPGSSVQLLVAGGTYSHSYWDFPYQPEQYSYVRHLVAAGYSTFAIDRIGIGESSHPLSALITMGENAYVVHEIVQDLRQGSIGGVGFQRVLLVGHSLGSVTAWIEAGNYHDVDGVIITGLVHHLNALNLATLLTTLYPAALDPRFVHTGLDVGYLTTEPGTRERDFYYAPGVDPGVLATDEATKETATSGEFASFALSIVDGISALITVPVLVVLGQQDSLFCGLSATDCSSATTVQEAEAPFYTAPVQLQVVVIPNAGHDLNLHKTAPLWFAAATTWAQQHIAP